MGIVVKTFTNLFFWFSFCEELYRGCQSFSLMPLLLLIPRGVVLGKESNEAEATAIKKNNQKARDVEWVMIECVLMSRDYFTIFFFCYFTHPERFLLRE